MKFTININYNEIYYYSAPKNIQSKNKEIDPVMVEYFERLSVPIIERDAFSGKIAVDAVLDSISVGTTF